MLHINQISLHKDNKVTVIKNYEHKNKRSKQR